MKRHSLILLGTSTGVAAVALLAALVLGGVPPFASAGGPTGLANARCQHVGGGQWVTVWDNASGAPPRQAWINESGYYWAAYNNTTGALAGLSWGSPGVREDVPPGATGVNMTNESATAEAMMQYGCENPQGGIPWHYDFATHLFVRDS